MTQKTHIEFKQEIEQAQEIEQEKEQEDKHPLDDVEQSVPHFIYIGPTIQHLDLPQYIVYLGGLPPEAEELKQSVPLSALLFISISELAGQDIFLKDPTSVESVAFRAVMAWLSDKGSA